MGSMTGAPKINAIKYASAFENFNRGIYSGTVGMIEPNGNFETYLDGMRAICAPTASIEHFIATLRKGTPVADALQQANTPQAAQDFVNYNFSLIEAGKAHEIASAFTFGREDVIPDMFIAILDRSATSEDSFIKFRYYLDRHIELDGDEHGPIALKMIDLLALHKAPARQGLHLTLLYPNRRIAAQPILTIGMFSMRKVIK